MSKFWMKDEEVCAEVAFAIQNHATISLKRSSLQPKLLQSVYKNSCMAYRLVTNLETYRVNFGLLFRGAIFPQRISRTLFVRARRNLAT